MLGSLLISIKSNMSMSMSSAKPLPSFLSPSKPVPKVSPKVNRSPRRSMEEEKGVPKVAHVSHVMDEEDVKYDLIVDIFGQNGKQALTEGDVNNRDVNRNVNKNVNRKDIEGQQQELTVDINVDEEDEDCDVLTAARAIQASVRESTKRQAMALSQQQKRRSAETPPLYHGPTTTTTTTPLTVPILISSSSAPSLRAATPSSTNDDSDKDATQDAATPTYDYTSNSSFASNESEENDVDSSSNESDNDEAWINNSQPKSPQNKLFEMVKIQMEQQHFPEANGAVGYDSRFVDGPLPLMDIPSSPTNRTLERPKTGMGYQLPRVEHDHGGSDPELLVIDEENEGGSKPRSEVGPEALHDIDSSNFLSSLLHQRHKIETVINPDDPDSPPASSPPTPSFPHLTPLYSYSESARSAKNSVRNNGSSTPHHSASTPFSPLPPNTLAFDSFFESGNLSKAYHVSGRSNDLTTVTATFPNGGISTENVSYLQKLHPVDQEYELYLRTDTHTAGNIQWFYFSATPPANATFPMSVRINIVNFMKRGSLYQYGMRPLVCDGDGKWVRGGEEIAYFRNKLTYQTGKKKKKQRHSTLSFTYTFTKREKTFFAHCYPYTYSDLQNDLSSIFSRVDTSATNSFIRTRDMCLTLAGNRCEMLTITSPGETNPEEMERRPAVVISARVHPGESNSSYMMRGVLRFICSDNPDAKVLRDNFVFKIVPMLNPDGVVHGNYRTSLSGNDLNRRYASPSPVLHPTVYAMRQMLTTMQESRGVLMFVDMHGHSRKKNTFLYGCDHGSKNLEQRLLPRVFPRLLYNVFRSDRSDQGGFFSYKDCDFNVRKSKFSTGRVVAWRDIGIDNSFTLEASFAGTGDNSEQAKRKRQEEAEKRKEDDEAAVSNASKIDREKEKAAAIHHHFGIDHFENIGVGLCKALLHYCRIGAEGEKLKGIKLIENNYVGGGANAGNDSAYEADDEQALNINNHRSTRRPINRRRPHIIRPALAKRLMAPVVLSEKVAISQASHCERARAELDVRKYLYIRQKQELKIFRSKIEAAEQSTTKKSKAAKQKHEANLALLEQELTVSAELKGDGEGKGVMELVDRENDSDLLEAGVGSEESLGSDSDPSGDNMPPNLLLKDKEFQKFVQRSTVAPQLAHMELNSSRRNQHRRTSKALKSKRKKVIRSEKRSDELIMRYLAVIHQLWK
ncbi:hypothetical protein TL16_g05755 [Triparma laevis f. inornata]|uniref:Peptidase M14 domain-containing protein n=1 Tax=Triparma laevis f. inornata TaxID=1714386 RepID=A0A9W7E816_9STRA|nr:hypothetical protein TL16_g05755 [Triparma laevis f. inornata]